MELDEIKDVWDQQESENNTNFSSEEYVRNIDQKMADFEQSIESRDRFEIIACILVIGIFGYVLLTSSTLLKQLGAGIVIAGAVYVWYRLKSAQNTVTADTADRSMRQHLKYELQQVQEQKKMLQNIVWWYITPIYTGLVLLTIGSNSSVQFKVIYFTLLTIVGIAVWYYNQYNVKKRFDPLIEEITEAIAFIEEEKETG